MTADEQKKDGYITLKEASERFGYAPDYIGQLIRKGKIEGKQVYANVAWMTTPEAIEKYLASNSSQKNTTAVRRLSFVDLGALMVSKKWISWMLVAISLFLLFLLLALFFVYGIVSADKSRADSNIRATLLMDEVGSIVLNRDIPLEFK